MHIRNITDLSMYKVYCCYFDEANLQVVDGKDLKVQQVHR